MGCQYLFGNIRRQEIIGRQNCMDGQKRKLNFKYLLGPAKTPKCLPTRSQMYYDSYPNQYEFWSDMYLIDMINVLSIMNKTIFLMF